MEQVDRQYEYHRLARSWPRYRWWKPLVTALLGVVIYVVFTIVLLIVAAIIAFATNTDIEQYASADLAIDLSDPVIFAFTLVSLILMIPSLVLAVLIMGPRPIGLLSSVAGRIRWRWLAVCAAVALAVFLASLLVSAAIGFFFPDESFAVPGTQNGSVLLVMLALSIVAVPFQAAAEEYVFRGFLMQTIGGWLRHPAFAILLPVPLFVVAHGYDPLGQIDVAIFAIVAGWITWRTGGLEAAIAVHAINNMTIFVLGAFGLADVNSSEGTVGGLVLSVATLGATAAVIVRLADRRGISRTRSVPPPPVLPISQPAWAGALPGGSMPPVGRPVAPVQPSAPALSWNPEQYDPARYDSVQHGPGPTGGPAPAPAEQKPKGAVISTPRPVETDPGRAPAPESGIAPDSPSAPESGTAPARSTGPADRATEPDAEGHPTGPAHPPGPGYPPGTPYPGGPGYPAAEVDKSDRKRPAD
ncbi:CPBP family intramembrane metalloprotease [Arthrobacter echini]|uniref:CPBP family intramembrane metalloprotease n=1 Tax=Arthrobacter echini TaxID=1529066 RepID=A0A4S5E8J7_9MICC|nr:type II CAAX endopeptidase family protein [Arthrobacter echini]THJ67958.1 CPBP family intramembrane metalloprotease [Arthrobacter echini]